jgi:signal transduction histidine kinase
MDVVIGLGTGAAQELRSLVGSLDTGVAIAPAVGPRDRPVIEDLVGQARRSGLDVELNLMGRADPIDPGLNLTAYRILQEALTNVRRHAGAARTVVTVEYAAECIALAVVNERGSSDSLEVLPGAGQGLIGIRERAAVFSGHVEAGPTPDGGFRLSVTLPRQYREPAFA